MGEEREAANSRLVAAWCKSLPADRKTSKDLW